MAYDGTRLFYLNQNEVWQLNPDTGAVVRSDWIGVGGGFQGTAALDGELYLLSWNQSVVEFDPGMHLVTQVLTLSWPSLNEPPRLGSSSQGGDLTAITSPDALPVTGMWADPTSGQWEQGVLQIDPATGVVSPLFAYPAAVTTGSPYPQSLAVVEGSIYAGVNQAPFGMTAPLYVLSRSGTLEQTIPLSYGVNALGGDDVAADPAGYTVTVASGAVSQGSNFGTQINILDLPAVTAINPPTGPTLGGTTVVITGTNFGGAAAVDFGATPASTFVVDSATQITATSPPGIGTVDVTVATADGTSDRSSADQFTYLSPYTVQEITDPAGNIEYQMFYNGFHFGTLSRPPRARSASGGIQIKATSTAGEPPSRRTCTSPAPALMPPAARSIAPSRNQRHPGQCRRRRALHTWLRGNLELDFHNHLRPGSRKGDARRQHHRHSRRGTVRRHEHRARRQQLPLRLSAQRRRRGTYGRHEVGDASLTALTRPFLGTNGRRFPD